MGRRGLPYGEILFVGLQNSQKPLLEEAAAFGIVVMMLNRRFSWRRDAEYQIVRLASSLLFLFSLSLYWDEE